MTAPLRARRVRRVVGRAAALASFALLAAAGVLRAHARLTGSTPAAGVTLTASPEAVSLVFSEAPELAFTKVVLLGPDSSQVPIGEVRHVPGSPLAVAASLPSPLGAGRYTVVWQTAAADGHPSRGRFSFTVAAPTVAAPTGAVAGPPPAATPRRDTSRQMPMPTPEAEGMAVVGSTTFDADAPLSVIVRWLSFASLLAIVGACAFRWLVLPAAERSATRHARAHGVAAAVGEHVLRRAAHLGVFASVLLLAAAATRLVVESYAMHGAADAMVAGEMAGMLGDTAWGVAWLAQVGAAVVALAAFAFAGARVRADADAGWGSRSAPWAVAALAALVLAFTPAMAGHAASSPRLAWLAIAADGLHVLGAGGWLGSLLVVVALGVPAALALAAEERGPAVADLVEAFSPTALAFAGLVALTGVFAGWLHLGSLPALWRSDYGRTLLVKLALVAVLVVTAAYNWLRVRPALGDADGARRVRRSATVELTFAILVLLVTAILVALPAPLQLEALRPEEKASHVEKLERQVRRPLHAPRPLHNLNRTTAPVPGVEAPRS